MKKIISVIVLVLSGLVTISCGVGNNIAITTTPGNCPNGMTNAPYCMAVTLQSNGGGQNFVNSTNFPINNLVVSVSGVNNIITPSSGNNLDPNGCTTSTILPGTSCTFYLEINQESYAVGIQNTAIVTLTYSYNNSLFGLGADTTNYTTEFNVTENTNLYILQNVASNNVGVNIYNSSGINSYSQIESQVPAISLAMDNSVYGFLYLTTSGSNYSFGNGNSQKIATPISSSVNNLFSTQTAPYTSGNAPTSLYGTSGGQIYVYNLTSQTWNSGITGANNIQNNINAVFLTGQLLLAGQNNVFNCSLSGASVGCTQEGGVINNIVDIATSSIAVAPGFTGLFVGTKTGLFVESGSQPAPTNTFVQVSGIGNNINITALTSDGSGNIYAAESTNKIWVVHASSPTVAVQITPNPTPIQSNVTSLLYDNFGQVLYITAGSYLYSCANNNNTWTCQQISGNLSSSNIVGMTIGSSLSN